jgi:hypothetical protein
MTMRQTTSIAALLVAAVLVLPALAGAAAADKTFTYSRDVAPILQERCQVCHREGEMAPMTLESYGEVRPWAKSIANQVAARDMPPYGAHPSSRDFLGDLYLSDDEVETIVAWARAGAPEGDPADLPTPKRFQTYEGGWKLGDPDVVLPIPETFTVPAGNGDDLYYCFPIDFSVPVDLWLKGIEFKPDNPAVVHHFILFMDPQGSFPTADATTPEVGVECAEMRRRVPGSQSLDAWAPGGTKALAPEGMGRLFTADTKLVLQIHYSNQTGEPQPDRSSIALHIASPEEKITKAFHKRYAGLVANLDIEAGNPEARHEGRSEINENITVYSTNAHMHKRGKSMLMTAVLPGQSEEETVLWVPDYDFDWQWNYEFVEPMKVPAGTVFIVRSVHDNSADNPDNPDPTVDVTWGDASGDEMMFNIYTYSVDDEVLDVTPNAFDPAWLEGSTSSSTGSE